MTWNKTDNNQKGIVDKLRKFEGVTVRSVSDIKKFCDIIVGYEGKNYLFELKTDNKKKLTEGEKEFQENWKGQINTVISIVEILQIIGWQKKKQYLLK